MDRDCLCNQKAASELSDTNSYVLSYRFSNERRKRRAQKSPRQFHSSIIYTAAQRTTMSESNNINRQLYDELFEFCQSDSLLSEEGLRELIEQYGLTHPILIRTIVSAMSEGGNNNQQPATVLLQYELERYCKSDSLSGEGLRELIARHGLTPNNNHNLSDNYEFFLRACNNKRVNEGIIRCLLEHFPDAASATDEDGWSPLHRACNNNNATQNIVQLINDATPGSVCSVTNDGSMPLHVLCFNRGVDKAAAIQILKLLIEIYPEAVQHVDNDGRLPIHHAAGDTSPEFCRVLIEAYPGSERIVDGPGLLPFHWACYVGSLPTVEYLYRLFPDAIVTSSAAGVYPIHAAISNMTNRDDPMTAAETVQFLLDCDANVTLQSVPEMSLLGFACGQEYNDANIDAGIQITKIIFDAHPEAIEDDVIARNIHHNHQQVQAFINREVVYARQAKKHRLMTTPDDNGQLPLHTAVQNNVTLGSIKLLVNGNPSAIRCFDDNGVIPLHVACQYHNSASVVGYMVSLADLTLDTIDRQGNTALHYACLGSKYQTIALLLEKYDAVSVSNRNAHGKLPIELLWESDQVDRESVEYSDSIFRLLKAYPEALRDVGTDVQPASAARSGESGIRKIR